VQSPPSAIEQIQALLSGHAFQFTKAVTGKSKLTGEEYKSVFTVSRQQVLDYVRTHGLPPGAWSSRPGSADGLHMIERDGKYSVYFQERGIAFDETSHKTRADAEIALAKWLLALSGTGLYATLATPTKVRWWSRFVPNFFRSAP
jgi:hypothetical protein